MIEVHRRPKSSGNINIDTQLDVVRNSEAWHEIVDTDDKTRGFVTYNAKGKLFTMLGVQGTLASHNETSLRNAMRASVQFIKHHTLTLTTNKSPLECNLDNIKVGDTFTIDNSGAEYIVAGVKDHHSGLIPCLTVGGLRPQMLAGDLIAYPTSTVVGVSH